MTLELIASTCAGCGKDVGERSAVWDGSVNLTADVLFIETCMHLHGQDIVEADVAFDWCSLVCFCRWLYRAAVHMGARPRP